MKILVTGGAGFIGSHIADAALTGGHEVAVLDDLSTGRRANLPAAAEFFETDIRDAQAVQNVFSSFAPEVVCHQAAQVSVSLSVRNPIFDAEVNVLGLLNVLNAARAAGTRRFVFASTGGALYGEVPDGELATVQWPPRPRSPYACGKCAGEAYLAAAREAGGLDCTILRYGNVYGPRQDPHGEAGVVAIFHKKLLAGQPIQINARRTEGDDGCVRDYVYVADVVAANLAAIEGKIDRPIVNIGTGEGTSTASLADRIQKALSVEAEIAHAPPRPGDLERNVLAPDDLKRIVGEPTTLDAGLASTAEYFRARVE